jgi:hypothetical protein
MQKFVCAFRGRRDSYQVPLALAGVDLLDQFITDAYAVPWLKMLLRWAPRSVRAKLDFRCEPLTPTDRVCCLWGTTLLERPPSLRCLCHANSCRPSSCASLGRAKREIGGWCGISLETACFGGAIDSERLKRCLS